MPPTPIVLSTDESPEVRDMRKGQRKLPAREASGSPAACRVTCRDSGLVGLGAEQNAKPNLQGLDDGDTSTPISLAGRQTKGYGTQRRCRRCRR